MKSAQRIANIQTNRNWKIWKTQGLWIQCNKGEKLDIGSWIKQNICECKCVNQSFKFRAKNSRQYKAARWHQTRQFQLINSYPQTNQQEISLPLNLPGVFIDGVAQDGQQGSQKYPFEDRDLRHDPSHYISLPVSLCPCIIHTKSRWR